MVLAHFEGANGQVGRYLSASPNVRGLKQLGGIAVMATLAAACAGNDLHLTFGSSGGTLGDELAPAS